MLANINPRTAQAEPMVAATSATQAVVPVLRGRALELLDEHGQVRSRINVEPVGEVMLRLLDKNGTIRVKLGASENGSGLVLLDETTQPRLSFSNNQWSEETGQVKTAREQDNGRSRTPFDRSAHVPSIGLV